MDDIWELLNSGGIQAAPLNVLIEKLEDGPYGRTVGIVASTWLTQASLSTSTPPSGENHILGSLVHRMMYYLRLPATFVVVFDGPCCESESRRNKYIASYELAQNFKEFLRALGVSSHTAPGEAEPELAEMTRRHLLGAVLTDSFQVVAFGALKIIRDSTLKEGRDSIFYTAASIEEKSGLGRGGLVLIATLIGGPSHQGLLGCGRVIAQSLAQKGFGDSLLTAVQTLNQDALEEFLSRWKVAVIDALASSAHGDVGRRYPTLAQRIRDDPHFPPVRALRHYVSPRTSWSVGAGPRVFPPVSLPMDLAAVGFLCEKFLQWGTTLKTRNVLFKLLYPGACVQVLARVLLLLIKRGRLLTFTEQHDLESLRRDDSGNSDAHLCFFAIQSIKRLQLQPWNAYLVRADTFGLHVRARSQCRNQVPPSAKGQIYFWVPRSLMEYALPDLVQTFVLKRAHHATRPHAG